MAAQTSETKVSVEKERSPVIAVLIQLSNGTVQWWDGPSPAFGKTLMYARKDGTVTWDEDAA